MAIIRQSLTETANTFSQNQTLNGTANTAPNQTAASASSLMSRTLVDDEPFFNIGRCFSPLPVPSTGVLRGTVSVNTDGNYVNLSILSSTAASSYARASLARYPTGFGFGGIAYANRLGFMIKGNVTAGNLMGSFPMYIRIIMGGNGGVPAASNANALTDRGFGVEILGYDVSGDSDIEIFARAFCHNGTAYNVGTFTRIAFLAFSGSIGAISNGTGSVSLFVGEGLARPISIQTISGGPTASGGSNWLDAVAVNSSAGANLNNMAMSITDMKVIAG